MLEQSYHLMSENGLNHRVTKFLGRHNVREADDVD